MNRPRDSEAVEEHLAAAVAPEEVDIRPAIGMWALGWPSDGGAPGTMSRIQHDVFKPTAKGSWGSLFSCGRQGKGSSSSSLVPKDVVMAECLKTRRPRERLRNPDERQAWGAVRPSVASALP